MLVEKLLPDRKPWILIDHIIRYVPKKEIITNKLISTSDFFLMGHFPLYSVYPGMLMFEGLRQSAELLRVLSNTSLEGNHSEGERQLRPYHMKECEVRLLLPAEPGNTIEYTIELESCSEVLVYNAQGIIDGKLAIRAKWQEDKEKVDERAIHRT